MNVQVKETLYIIASPELIPLSTKSVVISSTESPNNKENKVTKLLSIDENLILLPKHVIPIIIKANKMGINPTISIKILGKAP
jgi:hypothetical protein